MITYVHLFMYQTDLTFHLLLKQQLTINGTPAAHGQTKEAPVKILR